MSINIWIYLLISILFIQTIHADLKADDDDDFSASFLSEETFISDEEELSTEDKPYLICGNNGLCSCLKGTQNVLNCSRAVFKEDNSPLNTAFLEIKNRDLVDFKTDIVYLTYNEIEILRNNRILPGQEKNVLYFDASYNRIEDVEKNAFDAFTNLKKLKLTHNRLRYEEISLDFNYIKLLDDGIFDNLGNLIKLVLDGNNGLKLTSKTFGSGLANLKTLSLDMCGFESLDDDVFKNLKSLSQLSLSGNPLNTIPKALGIVPNLQVLAFSETNLNELPKYAFKTNPQLSTIYMRRMQLLYSVNDCAFCGLNQLRTVDMSNSKHLYNINKNAFGGNSDKEELAPDFENLSVANCNFTTIPEELVDWAKLKKLDLDGNPWACDCTFRWMINNRKFQKFVRNSVPTCETPEELKGIALSHAQEKMNCDGYIPQTTPVATKSNNFLITFIVIGLVASICIVGFTYARRRGAVPQYLGQALSGQSRGGNPSDQLGYANLNRGVTADGGDEFDDGDQNRLEHDFNRPEFV